MLHDRSRLDFVICCYGTLGYTCSQIGPGLAVLMSMMTEPAKLAPTSRPNAFAWLLPTLNPDEAHRGAVNRRRLELETSRGLPVLLQLWPGPGS